jgi:hypothetical protein
MFLDLFDVNFPFFSVFRFPFFRVSSVDLLNTLRTLYSIILFSFLFCGFSLVAILVLVEKRLIAAKARS